MDEGEVIGRAFFPASGEAASAVQPAEGAFDDPATGFPARGGVDAILAPPAQMEQVAFGSG